MKQQHLFSSIGKRNTLLYTIMFWTSTIVLTSTQMSWAANTPVVFKEQIAKALQYKYATHSDSATLILKQVIDELNAQQAFDTPIALEARLHLAERKLYTSDDIEGASEELHQIMDAATLQQEWEILAHAQIVLAYLYELTINRTSSLEYLALAINLINEHQLKSLYPKYLIRRSTLFRHLTSNVDSVIHYANQALKHASLDDEAVKAEAYFALGRMTARESQRGAIDLYRKASRLYQKMGNTIEEVNMSIQIGEALYNLNQLDSANIYLDEAKRDFNKVTHVNLSRIYNYKALISRQQGKLDSAWYFLILSYEARIVKIELEKRRAVAEIEESYQNEKKNLELGEKEKALQLEKARTNWFIAAALVMLIFLMVLIYLYFQMRKINQINRQQAEQLKNLDQAKSRFFANVSHELRTPLTLMLGPVNNLLKGNNLSPKQATLLQTASDSGAKLQQLINEILNLRKLEMDKMEIYSQATLLHPFFTQYISQFDSLAAGKNLNFTYEIALDESLSADLDQEKTRQILQNLLTNAFKYTFEEEQINVKINLDQEILELVVADTGRGIHADDLPYLFDRYFQTNRKDVALEGGTGIGLALCKEYAELLGGTIQVKSVLGKGTTFRVFLPLTNLSRKKTTLANKTIPPIALALSNTVQELKPLPLKKTGKARILVVEDQPALRNYLNLLLSEKYEIVSAEHGQKAWDYLFSNDNHQQIDLILSDLMMPVMDGYQLLDKLKKQDATRHIPVVMLTARADLQDKLKALRIGINDYLIKPFEEEELLVRIDNLLQNQANRIVEAPAKNGTSTIVPLVSQEDEQWLLEFEAFVQKNLSNSILSVPMLADQFSMSEATLFRKLKHTTGLSPSQYLIEIRLEKALRLLENHTYNSISNIAYKVGYTDPNSFSRAFKRRYGKSPKKLLTI